MVLLAASCIETTLLACDDVTPHKNTILKQPHAAQRSGQTNKMNTIFPAHVYTLAVTPGMNALEDEWCENRNSVESAIFFTNETHTEHLLKCIILVIIQCLHAHNHMQKCLLCCAMLCVSKLPSLE